MNMLSRTISPVLDDRLAGKVMPTRDTSPVSNLMPTEVRESAPRPPPLRTIVVPIDGSNFAEHALPYALGIANHCNAKIHLVHVFSASEAVRDPIHLMVDQNCIARQRIHREEHLEGLTRLLMRAHPHVAVTGSIRDSGNVVEALHDATKDADLIVMAAHRRNAWSRFWRGGVTEQVLRSVDSPILLAPGREEPVDLTQPRLLRSILVPLDGTERAEQALRSAARIGTVTDARYDLLRVIRAWNFFGSSALGAGGMMPLPGEETEAVARQYLRSVSSRIGLDVSRAIGRVVIDDRPIATAILGNADRLAADVISLTTRGRGRFSRLIRESIAETVVHNGSIPVLLTRVS